MNKTKIEWATHTWNPVVGCSKVSAGCLNCYAAAMVHRFPWMTGGCAFDEAVGRGWDGQAHFFADRLEEPFRLRHGKNGPHRIFVCSMGDLFHDSINAEEVAAVFGAMAACQQHTFMVLTKRPIRAVNWFRWMHSRTDSESLNCAFHLLRKAEPDYDGPIHCKFGPAPDITWPLPNVWIGVSAEDQNSFDSRVKHLLDIPAVKHFVSIEPMLGSINVKVPIGPTDYSVDWVICGAETGPGKRFMNPEWALHLRNQCARAGVPFFFKKDSNGSRLLNGSIYEEWPT